MTDATALDQAVDDIHAALEGDVEGPTWMGDQVPQVPGSEAPVYEALVAEAGDPVARAREQDQALAELRDAIGRVSGVDRTPVPQLEATHQAVGELAEVDPAEWRTVVEGADE